MPKCRILIHGQNYLIPHAVRGAQDIPIKTGFYTNRFIDRTISNLSPMMLSDMLDEVGTHFSPVNDPEDPPRLVIEKIWEIDEVDNLDNYEFVQDFFIYPEDKPTHRKWVLTKFKLATQQHSGKKYRRQERVTETSR